MNAPAPARRRASRIVLAFWLLVVPALLIALYCVAVYNWNYSTGERAGWVQKFSKKGWVCKTWEGELAMVSMPGTTPEKFYFTVWDEKVAADINAAMGRRVSLHYDEKVGLPTSCFGETRHWVNHVTIVPEIPLAPGVMVPSGAQPSAVQPSSVQPSSVQPPSVQPGTATPPAAPMPAPAPPNAPTAPAAPPVPAAK